MPLIYEPVAVIRPEYNPVASCAPGTRSFHRHTFPMTFEKLPQKVYSKLDRYLCAFPNKLYSTMSIKATTVSPHVTRNEIRSRIQCNASWKYDRSSNFSQSFPIRNLNFRTSEKDPRILILTTKIEREGHTPSTKLSPIPPSR